MERRAALQTVFRVRRALCEALADLQRAAGASDEEVAKALEAVAGHLDEALAELDDVPAERQPMLMAASA